MANAIASQVQALYVGYLGRAADQAGLDFWTNAIVNGTSTIESVALGFTLSQEYTSKYEGLSNEELVAAIYQNVLGRAADADGLAFWVGELEKGVQTPATLLAAMLNSLGEIDQKVIDNKVYVANAYTAAAGADYDPEAGAEILEGVDDTDASVEQAIGSLLGSTVMLTADNTTLVPEGNEITFTVTPSAASETETTLYVQVSGASVGAISAQADINDFSSVLVPVTIPAGSSEPVTVSTTVVSDAVTEGPEGFQAQLLDASLTAIEGTVLTGTITENANVGQTFTLTTGADTIVGTSGNDTINALTINAAGTAADTLTAFDSIDGGAGNDTLNIYTDSTAAAGAGNKAFPSNVTVKNVETINYNNANAGVAIDASKFVGATAINQIGGAAAVTNLAAGTTAGFNGTTTGDLSVTAAAAATSATVALTNVVDTVTSLTVAGDALNAATVTGTVVDSAAADGVAPVALTVNAGKAVESVAVSTAVAANLTVGNVTGSTKTVSTVDASASTGAVTYNAATTVANVKTGAGNDTVTLATALDATTKAASVATGAGDDVLNVIAAAAAAVTGGTTVSVDAGEGKDTINLTIGANTAYDVKAGAGDDIVKVTNAVKTTDKIDGGDGNDTISLAGKATYVADDYIVLNKVLTNFETLQLTGVAVTNLDASQLATSYTTIDLLTGSTVTKVGTQALVANGALTATAAGTDVVAADKVYAGTLNITQKGAAGVITANADTVNLTVDASKGAAAATLEGFAKSANVTLTQALKADKSAFEGAATFSLTTAAGVDADLTSLKLSGNGAATVTNAASTKLVTVDASGLNSVTFDGKAAAGLTYASTNAAAETITLGGGIDALTINASTYGAADTITGLNLVLNADKTALEATSDTLIVTGISSTGTNTAKFTTTQTDLDLALKDAAALAGENEVVFHLGGNTYIYKDVADGGENLVDAGDILVKLTGIVDLDALVVALG